MFPAATGGKYSAIRNSTNWKPTLWRPIRILKAAVSRFEQARASANVAESAFYPRIGISILEVDQRDSKHRPVGGKPDQTYDTLSVPFDFSYEIDLWGRVRRSVESATAQAQASADDVESIKVSIQAEVAANFITLRTLDADKALLLSSIAVYRKSLDLVRNRRAGGMVSDLDVAQAETVLKTAEAQVPDIAIQRAKYQNALAVLTGKTASLFQLPERPLDMPPLVIPRRTAVGAAGTPAGYLRSRTPHGRRKRQYRRCDRSLFPNRQIERTLPVFKAGAWICSLTGQVVSGPSALP